MKKLIDQEDFRMYEPEMVKDRWGSYIRMVLCEEYDADSDRWEPFYTVLVPHNIATVVGYEAQKTMNETETGF